MHIVYHIYLNFSKHTIPMAKMMGNQMAKLHSAAFQDGEKLLCYRFFSCFFFFFF